MITAKDMQQAIEFPAMVQELAALYESGETYFVAWGTEDYKVLQTGCERHKIENPVKYEDYLDLALAYRLWKGEDFFVAREAYEAERAARQAERAKHHNGYRRW